MKECIAQDEILHGLSDDACFKHLTRLTLSRTNIKENTLISILDHNRHLSTLGLLHVTMYQGTWHGFLKHIVQMDLPGHL